MLKQGTFVFFFFLMIMLFSCQINRHKNGLKTGLWINKDDNGDVIYKSRGRFKNGKEKGNWKYFHSDTLFKTEKFSGNVSEMRFYHPNKKIMAIGKTQIDFNGTELHWYYHGDWKYFDPAGKLVKVITYRQGNPITEVSTNHLTN